MHRARQLPRIYYLLPHCIGMPEALPLHVSRCGEMGFTHLMMAAVVYQEPTGAPDAWSSVAPPDAIDAVVHACQAAGMVLLLDIDISAGPAPVPVLPDEDDSPPDPRPRISTAAPAVQHSSTHALFWETQVQQWLDRGVSGVACRALGSRVPGFWKRLTAQIRHRHPEALLIAWTPGCTASQVAALQDCGFDATLASTAWWDCRAPWFCDESARLAQVAPAIALVDDPLLPQLHHHANAGDSASLQRYAERMLQLAVASGSGLLIPMGFEYGLPGMQVPGSGKLLDLATVQEQGRADLHDSVTRANALLAQLIDHPAWCARQQLVSLSAPEADVAVLLRRPLQAQEKSGDAALLVVVNAALQAGTLVDLEHYGTQLAGLAIQESLWPPDSDVSGLQGVLLVPGAVHLYVARRLPPVVSFVNRGKRPAQAASRAARIVIEAMSPMVDGGQFPVRRIVGDQLEVEADVFMDGHDRLGVVLRWRPDDSATWHSVPMMALGNDRWRASMPLRRTGRHWCVIEAWRDTFATYCDELGKKIAAGLDVTLELEEGRLLIAAAQSHAAASDDAETAATLQSVVQLLTPADPGVPLRGALQKDDAAGAPAPATGYAQQIAMVLGETTGRAMQRADSRAFALTSTPVLAIEAERLAARFSSWYELFPRSQSGDSTRHGTFADVAQRLPAIAAMGFDTVYFPPIHPIGQRHRKGPNNSLTAAEGDPGSPYAIGAATGGHDAIHPELGTLAQFHDLCQVARSHGLDIALDFAIQCSPDHPWITAHPEWFAWRPDGAMRYAENPPKKYEDIVNVDFYVPGATPALWIALRNAVLFWVNQGVRVFRVDNPHTKPLPFWQWMIADIRSREPDVIFLSEAFTRPKLMYRLAKVGFSQSYSYFTWRHTKAEFTAYMTELSTTAVREFFRPHFFVNTPDINPVFLQKSGRPGFLIRAALATTLSGLWGMYSGFELCEATPVPGREDYLDSEKYQMRVWDWQRPGNIIAEITALNRIRRTNAALQSHLGIQFCDSSDDSVLCFLRFLPQPAGSTRLGENVVLVAICLDPFHARETTFSLPLWQLGLPDDGTLAIDDLLHGNHFTVQGTRQQLRLDPAGLPYVIWRLQAPSARGPAA